MRYCYFVLALLLLPLSTRAQSRILESDDAIRIAEAFTLAEQIKDSLWQGWSDVPFPILLLTPEKDFLINHPNPSDDFILEGVDAILGMNVYSRTRTAGWPAGMLATFPAIGGLATVVAGQAEATGLNSTRWVLTILHEHFHQYQYSQPGYYEGVAALDLSEGDETGMWMLNYDFPYDTEAATEAILNLRDSAESILNSGLDSDKKRKLITALEGVRDAVSEKDFRYFSFQLWQEGVSRYTEQLVAKFAIASVEQSAAFAGLTDAVPYEFGLNDLLETRRREMGSLDLAAGRRVVFYTLGSTLAMLLDEIDQDWQDAYHDHAFDLASLVMRGN